MSQATSKLICGDVIAKLKELPADSVHCVVTSPPYWSLRDYGVDGQIGLEKTPELFVAKMVEVFREVKRVLRPDGCCFLNLGDSYAGSSTIGRNDIDRKCPYAKGTNLEGRPSHRITPGLKPKDLCEMPSRAALALQADGWWLRSRIPWLKRNSMPESCTDRPSSAVEYIFLLTKSKQYFYDADAVRKETDKVGGKPRVFGATKQEGTNRKDIGNTFVDTGGRNRRNSDWFFQSWQGLLTDGSGPVAMIVNPQSYSEAHFATFPEKLVEPCILAGTSAKGCCPECGKPWRRVVEKDRPPVNYKARKDNAEDRPGNPMDRQGTHNSGLAENAFYATQTIGWQPGCECGGEPIPCTTLDPFCGSGTVGVVALKHKRSFIGIDLSADYLKLAEDRIAQAIHGVPAKELKAGQMTLFQGDK